MAAGVLGVLVGVGGVIASFVYHDKYADRTVRVVRSVRRYRQARGSHATFRSTTPLQMMPMVGGTAEIKVPERSYSFRSRQEEEDAESEVGSSRYDARSMAGWYRKELGLGEV
ncbi:hypothetical protein K440DRAFT_626143 [Wilcoxina mikolae CBS 423.85]|nr:hypothetical protein K440DRAFT_626143 [Wilcoxina mikolae CBS 423.85]